MKTLSFSSVQYIFDSLYVQVLLMWETLWVPIVSETQPCNAYGMEGRLENPLMVVSLGRGNTAKRMLCLYFQQASLDRRRGWYLVVSTLSGWSGHT